MKDNKLFSIDNNKGVITVQSSTGREVVISNGASVSRGVYIRIHEDEYERTSKRGGFLYVSYPEVEEIIDTLKHIERDFLQ